MKRYCLVVALLALLPGLALGVALDTSSGLPAYGVDTGGTSGTTVTSSAFSVASGSVVVACFIAASGVDLTVHTPTMVGNGTASGLSFVSIQNGDTGPAGGAMGVGCFRATASSSITAGTLTGGWVGTAWINKSIVVWALTQAGSTGATAASYNSSQGTASAINITSTGTAGSWIFAVNAGGPTAVTAPSYLANSTAIIAYTSITVTGERPNWAVYRADVTASTYTLGVSSPLAEGVMVTFEILDASSTIGAPLVPSVACSGSVTGTTPLGQTQCVNTIPMTIQ
jgi:hypothetical protein